MQVLGHSSIPQVFPSAFSDDNRAAQISNNSFVVIILGGIASSMCKPHCWIPRSWLCYPSDKVWTEAEPRPVAPVATLSSPLQLCHLDEQRYCQNRNIPRVCLKPQISVISEQHNLTTDCYWLIGCENKDNQTRCFIYTIIQRYSSTLSSHQCLCWYFTYL